LSFSSLGAPLDLHSFPTRRSSDLLEVTVIVHDVIAEVRDLLRDRQLGFAATQCFLGVSPDRHVANESDEARRIRALHPADGKLGIELAPVASLREQLSADTDDARLAELDVMTKVVFVLGSIRLRKQDVDLDADHLLLVVAEHAFAGMVQQLDSPLMVEK